MHNSRPSTITVYGAATRKRPTVPPPIASALTARSQILKTPSRREIAYGITFRFIPLLVEILRVH